tara:strand:+ start:88 stop:297 length:210 start_codon:yes stop_codon:yes gene_type:complete
MNVNSIFFLSTSLIGSIFLGLSISSGCSQDELKSDDKTFEEPVAIVTIAEEEIEIVYIGEGYYLDTSNE